MDEHTLEERTKALANDDAFVAAFEHLMDIAHDTAVNHGWWNPPKTFGEQLLLFHSEISEALEEFRNHKDVNEIYEGKNYKPEGVPIELADLLIRVFDTCAFYNIDLLSAILLKMNYNLTRSHRHGNKKL
jgi:hypothetical protein